MFVKIQGLLVKHRHLLAAVIRSSNPHNVYLSAEDTTNTFQRDYSIEESNDDMASVLLTPELTLSEGEDAYGTKERTPGDIDTADGTLIVSLEGPEPDRAFNRLRNYHWLKCMMRTNHGGGTEVAPVALLDERGDSEFIEECKVSEQSLTVRQIFYSIDGSYCL